MAEPKPGLFEELKRRRVTRVVSLYLVSGFVLLQVGDVAFDALGLPGWSQTFLIVLLALGLPLVAVLAWVFDITPAGGGSDRSRDGCRAGRDGAQGRLRRHRYPVPGYRRAAGAPLLDE